MRPEIAPKSMPERSLARFEVEGGGELGSVVVSAEEEDAEEGLVALSALLKPPLACEERSERKAC